jgi:hypothetical protein
MSCHPPAVFKSVATRLRLNCSLERFYSPRVEEYTRYLLASDYTRVAVEAAMEEARGRGSEELLQEPRSERREKRKFSMVTKYDPRAPNMGEGLKLLKEILHQNPENIRVFPKGSIVTGFRRGRNLWEIIAPTKPQRERRVEEVGGSGACDSSRCTLHQSGAVQECQEQEGRTGVL